MNNLAIFLAILPIIFRNGIAVEVDDGGSPIYERLKKDLRLQGEENGKIEKYLHTKLEGILRAEEVAKDGELGNILAQIREQAILIGVGLGEERLKLPTGREEVARENFVEFLMENATKNAVTPFLLHQKVATLVKEAMDGMGQSIGELLAKMEMPKVEIIHEISALKKSGKRDAETKARIAFKKEMLHKKAPFAEIFGRMGELLEGGIQILVEIMKARGPVYEIAHKKDLAEYWQMVWLGHLSSAGIALLDDMQNVDAAKNRENLEENSKAMNLAFLQMANKLDWFLGKIDEKKHGMGPRIDAKMASRLEQIGIEERGAAFLELTGRTYGTEQEDEREWKMLVTIGSILKVYYEKNPQPEEKASLSKGNSSPLVTTNIIAQKSTFSADRAANPHGFNDVLMARGNGLFALAESLKMMLDQEEGIVAGMREAERGGKKAVEVVAEYGEEIGERTRELVDAMQKVMPELRGAKDRVNLGVMEEYAKSGPVEMLSENPYRMTRELYKLKRWIEVQAKLDDADKISLQIGLLREFIIKGRRFWMGTMEKEGPNGGAHYSQSKEFKKFCDQEEKLLEELLEWHQLSRASITLAIALQNWFVDKNEENLAEMRAKFDRLQVKMGKMKLEAMGEEMANEIVREKRGGRVLFEQMTRREFEVKLEVRMETELLEAIARLAKYYYGAIKKETM